MALEKDGNLLVSGHCRKLNVLQGRRFKLTIRHPLLHRRRKKSQP
eukprot:CAMPEP_0197742568 /NCGR_PEP_ID=MMETSP1435-20131217/31769_1 /TAXON_ID=426625 /ORGANISM="Chaetoceros brevis, Strain CCMP164" /LENGTH=44 /DNA_ID= /DNA_START= /DNA_END= /DNA_ORIENTATION=